MIVNILLFFPLTYSLHVLEGSLSACGVACKPVLLFWISAEIGTEDASSNCDGFLFVIWIPAIRK